MSKRIAAAYWSPSPISTLTRLAADLRDAIGDFHRGRLAIADVDRHAAAMRLAAAVEAVLPEIEDAKATAGEASRIIAARAMHETAVEAGVEDWRFDGWLDYLDERADDEQEALDAMTDDDHEAAMAEWRKHAAEWDMGQF